MMGSLVLSIKLTPVWKFRDYHYYYCYSDRWNSKFEIKLIILLMKGYWPFAISPRDQAERNHSGNHSPFVMLNETQQFRICIYVCIHTHTRLCTYNHSPYERINITIPNICHQSTHLRCRFSTPDADVHSAAVGFHSGSARPPGVMFASNDSTSPPARFLDHLQKHICLRLNRAGLCMVFISLFSRSLEGSAFF